MTRPCVLGSTNGQYLQRWWSSRLAWAGRRTLPSALLALSLAGLALAETPQGTAFSYQGTLLQGGVPVNANVDLVFDLFDAAVAGNQVAAGAPFTAANGNPVSVQGGVFTVALDFGPLAFNSLVSQERYLQVTVNESVLQPAHEDPKTPRTPCNRARPNWPTPSPMPASEPPKSAPAGIGLSPRSMRRKSGASQRRVRFRREGVVDCRRRLGWLRRRRDRWSRHGHERCERHRPYRWADHRFGNAVDCRWRRGDRADQSVAGAGARHRFVRCR